MRYIGNGLVCVVFPLFMTGCMADDSISTSDDNGSEPSDSEDGSVLGDKQPGPSATGIFTMTTDCGASAWQSPATGTAHAQIRNCMIIWGKDTSSSPTAFFQTVKFDLRDASTDGVCARARVNEAASTFQECNGVWRSIPPASLNGHHSSLSVTLSWGGNDLVTKSKAAPSGF